MRRERVRIKYANTPTGVGPAAMSKPQQLVQKSAGRRSISSCM
ncbi:hypothetical protein CpipJ_CPIJ006359 [Culex quinquefasciatus]|uniref:Uncharacterized protein n=2 Tax=Culex pipiens complex TaxID=518105 RepID=B0WGR2_CULQU|nr:hypothetical protein CpipJ_CPIJ006359 [Culex quinquefasciatus]|eukprot:XP_001847896.1 hypothetical protein CpipJ_CPIJ006359 [Culex quinquefasciatus]